MGGEGLGDVTPGPFLGCGQPTYRAQVGGLRAAYSWGHSGVPPDPTVECGAGLGGRAASWHLTWWRSSAWALLGQWGERYSTSGARVSTVGGHGTPQARAAGEGSRLGSLLRLCRLTPSSCQSPTEPLLKPQVPHLSQSPEPWGCLSVLRGKAEGQLLCGAQNLLTGILVIGTFLRVWQRHPS